MNDYYCFKCNKYHYRTSKVGQRHTKYEFQKCEDCGTEVSGMRGWYYGRNKGPVICVECEDKRRNKEIEEKMETVEEHSCYLCGKVGKYYPELREYSLRHEVRPRVLPKLKEESETVWVCVSPPVTTVLEPDWYQNPLRIPKTCETLMSEISNEKYKERTYRKRKGYVHEEKLQEMKTPFVKAVCAPIRKWAKKAVMFSVDLECKMLGVKKPTMTVYPKAVHIRGLDQHGLGIVEELDMAVWDRLICFPHEMRRRC